MIYFPKCEGKGSFPKFKIKSLICKKFLEFFMRTTLGCCYLQSESGITDTSGSSMLADNPILVYKWVQLDITYMYIVSGSDVTPPLSKPGSVFQILTCLT